MCMEQSMERELEGGNEQLRENIHLCQYAY
jgi:hypothetical protein